MTRQHARAWRKRLIPLPHAYTLAMCSPASHVTNNICRGVCHCSPILHAGLHLVGLIMCLTSRQCRRNCASTRMQLTYLSSMATRYLEHTNHTLGFSIALFKSTVVSSLCGGNRNNARVAFTVERLRLPMATYPSHVPLHLVQCIPHPSLMTRILAPRVPHNWPSCRYQMGSSHSLPMPVHPRAPTP